MPPAIIVPQNGVMDFLEDRLRDVPGRVHRKLAEGDHVEKAGRSFLYEIDDPQIVKRIGEYPPGPPPYLQIYRFPLDPDNWKIYDLFETNGRKEGNTTVLPFSTVIDSGYGVCLDKAILMQLAMQGTSESRLVLGTLIEDGCVQGHAYTIAMDKKGIPHLIDTVNTFRKVGGSDNFATILPIEGIGDQLKG